MKKRLLSFFLASLMLLSLAACGETGALTDTAESGTVAGDHSVSATDSGSSDEVSSVSQSDSSVTDGVTDSGVSSDGETDAVSDGSSVSSSDPESSDSEEDPEEDSDVPEDDPSSEDVSGGIDLPPEEGVPEEEQYTDVPLPDDTDDASDTSSSAGTSSSRPSGGSSGGDTGVSSPPANSEETPGDDSSGSSGSSTDSSTSSSGGTTSNPGSTESAVNKILNHASGYDNNVDHLFLATDVLNRSIVVFDLDLANGDFNNLANGDQCVVWEWFSERDPNCKIKPGGGIDAAKLRYSPYYKKDVVIATSSSGWAGVIDYQKRTVLWEYRIGNGPHSIEMMPNGDVVVACSSGADAGKLTYVPLSAGKTSPSSTINSPSAHGVMWDPENEWLWVLEYKQIYACEVLNYGTKTAKLSRISGKSVGFSNDASGHAFTPVLGSPGKYWVSAGHVYLFDSDTMTLTRVGSSHDSNGVKGITYFSDGTMIQTVAGSGRFTTHDWSCGELRIITMEWESGKTKPVAKEVCVDFNSEREFYKVQPFTKSYQ